MIENEENEAAKDLEKLLKNIPNADLINFVAGYARKSINFSKALVSKFAPVPKKKAERLKKDDYHGLLKKGLSKVKWTAYEFYKNLQYGDGDTIDVLDKWLTKAEGYMAKGDLKTAVAIAKACIEEFAEWLLDSDFEISPIEDYVDIPFNIFSVAADSPSINSADLYAYCKAELEKPIYLTQFIKNFYDVMQELAGENEAADFLQLQDKLLSEVVDNSSKDAEEILDRKIAFYNRTNQFEKAEEVLLANLQVANFYKKRIGQLLANKAWAEARTSVDAYLKTAAKNLSWRMLDYWQDLLLQIAQNEADIATVRQISYNFIEKSFEEKYYEIYKNSFSAKDWAQAVEQLLSFYQKRARFSYNIGQVLAAEKMTARLLACIEGTTDIEILINYYRHLAEEFPAQTLAMFETRLDKYAKDNLGRDTYQYVVAVLRKMKAIKDGEILVQKMVDKYKIQYKARKAMLEILATL